METILPYFEKMVFSGLIGTCRSTTVATGLFIGMAGMKVFPFAEKVMVSPLSATLTSGLFNSIARILVKSVCWYLCQFDWNQLSFTKFTMACGFKGANWNDF